MTFSSLVIPAKAGIYTLSKGTWIPDQVGNDIPFLVIPTKVGIYN